MGARPTSRRLPIKWPLQCFVCCCCVALRAQQRNSKAFTALFITIQRAFSLSFLCLSPCLTNWDALQVISKIQKPSQLYSSPSREPFLCLFLCFLPCLTNWDALPVIRRAFLLTLSPASPYLLSLLADLRYHCHCLFFPVSIPCTVYQLSCCLLLVDAGTPTTVPPFLLQITLTPKEYTPSRN